MPSKARLLAKSMIESPILSEITTNPTVTPTTITTAVNDVATGNFATIDLLPSTGNDVGDQAFVQATNRLYIWSGSGWYNIALINTTPTWDSGGQPAVTYELSADSPQTATTITLAASDPEGFPITYSHVTGGSMDSIATVSQDSSVFTITPKTVAQAPDGGTGSITFRATDGVNILPYVSSFTLNFITIITNSKHTSLLATATGTSDNNNITDASTNNHTITVNGDVYTGTFSPYRSGGYSWDFEGAGFYTNDAGHGESIEAENTASAFNVGTNDYSVEGWFKERNSGTYSTNAYARLFDLGPNDNISLMRNYPNTGGKKLLLKENATVIITSTNDVFDGNWHFIQVIRTGGYTKLYVDGTEEGSIASTTNINAISKIIVGAWSDYSYGFDGQIADFRFSNTARTAAVPTERLTSDSNTKLLVCSKPYLVDESGTATSLTLLKSANGTRDYPDAVAFSPYDYNEYAAADHGGSVFIEANGGHLSGTLSSGGLGTTFTVEMWIYDDGTGGATPYGGYFTTTDLSSQYGIQLRRYGAYIFNSTTGTNLTWAANGDPFATVFGVGWHHVAAVHNGSTFKVYVDGKEIISTSDSHTYSSVNYKVGYPWLYLSNHPDQQAQAYISDLRINKSVIYSGEFTPPTAPLSSSGAELHIKGTDASIIDKSQGVNLKLEGNTTGSTTQVKFASTKSMYFDGTGDYLTTGNNSNLNLGTGALTVELWYYLTNSQNHTLFELHDGYPNGGGTSYDNNRAKMAITFTNIYLNDGTANVGNYAETQVINQWRHWAWSRDASGNNRFYLNGTQIGTTVSSSNNLITPVVDLGRRAETNSTFMQGYIQDFRLTKGLARYTANFTPPTASLEG